MIRKETFDFLRKLKKNNNRDWFEKNKPHYLAAKDDVEKSLSAILKGIRSFDKRFTEEMEAKKFIFRIYRDVRFSKDKRPYKTNIGASINELNAASNVASAESVNLTSAEDSVRSTNYGQATSNMASLQVLSQTGISALAQANSVQQEILKLMQ